MLIRSLVNSLVGSLLVMVSTGCGALFASSQHSIAVGSYPEGAQVMVDGMPVATTPGVVSVANKKDHQITVRLDGFSDAGCLISSNVAGGYVVLDFLFTGLLGVVVDAVTSSWSTIDQDACTVRLKPAPLGPAAPPPVARQAVSGS